jgi:hypothetical protein
MATWVLASAAIWATVRAANAATGCDICLIDYSRCHGDLGGRIGILNRNLFFKHS